MSISSRSLPPISPELADVLFRASLINAHREKSFDLSFGTTLLGFLASKAPLAQWFQHFVETRRINVDEMLASHNVNREILNEVATRKAGHRVDAEWRSTAAVKALFDAANEILVRIGRDLSFDFPAKELGEHHFLAAYIYRSDREHTEELASWGFDLEEWSHAFLTEMGVRYPRSDFSKWLEIHQEIFKTTPEFSPELLTIPSQSTKEQTPPDSSQSQATKEQTATEASDAKATINPRRSKNDQTQLLLDSPSTEDVLGRKYFAETLAVRMNRAWERYRESAAKGSFMLHIHGAWGSGKSSLLNFLRDELQPNPAKRTKQDKEARQKEGHADWIVVDFNAWQRQRVEPPWWSLIDTVYTQARSQLKTVYGDPVQSWKLMLRERWWRFTTGRKDHLIALLISLLLLGGVFYWAQRHPSTLPDVIKSGATLLGVVGGIWSTLLLVSRSFLSGSSQSAQAFMQRSGDPMERVSKHFIDLAHWIDKPIAIFVDDLDRCQTTYVVTLLEGIQTVFNTPRVVYVITADRRWLYVCFEKIYENFVDVVNEPGRQLGSLFLEKAFETSISMPRMSPERRTLYWDHLVQGKQSNVANIESVTAKVAMEFKNDQTETQVLERLKEGSGDILEDEIRKGAAVRQLANQKVVESTEYFLKPFAPLTEPNPRAMKRLVNAYTLLRDMAVLGGSNVLFDSNTKDQLALWAIVSLRWPLLKEHLEQHLEENPDETPDVIELVCKREPIPITKHNLHELANSNEVFRVFNGIGIGTKLDKSTICSLVGISAAQPKSGGVA